MWLIPVETDQPVQLVLVSPSNVLKDMQTRVGGHLEELPLRKYGLTPRISGLVVYVNEDGLSLNLPRNTRANASGLRGVVGPVLISCCDECGDTVSMPLDLDTSEWRNQLFQ